MAVFSRFARVVDSDGEAMRVRTALGLINQVLGEVLDEQEATFDQQTRWAIAWFEQYFFDEKPYGLAEQLAVAMDVSVQGMREAGILASGGGKVRLLNTDELLEPWDPLTDRRTPVWEATHYLVKRLDEGGESAAGELLRQLGGLGESAQLLAYRLYTICETPRPVLAGPYNALVQAWPSIQSAAHAAPLAAQPVDEQASFDLEGEG
jgi:putative DNA methylase